MLSAEYIQKGLLFTPPPFSIRDLLDHLKAALAEILATYYPVAGRFATEQHRDERGHVIGCSVSIDCSGQGVDIIHAVADGVAISDVVPPGRTTDVPHVVQSFFPLDGAVDYDGHEVPLFAIQVTELRDGVFLGFAYNHALSDGTAFWDFINSWARIARAKLILPHPDVDQKDLPSPLFRRWSPDGGAPVPVVLPYADASVLIERPSPVPLRERMLHFSEESLAALKEKARQELLAAGDAAGAAAVTRFQALSSLLWRSITRARTRGRLADNQETVCRLAINNRARLRPPLPAEYFGNTIYAIPTESVRVSELLERGHGWAAAAVGRAVAGHTDADIRARVQAWMLKPIVYTQRFFDPNGTMMGSSPRFDMYGCDFGWGEADRGQERKSKQVRRKDVALPFAQAGRHRRRTRLGAGTHGGAGGRPRLLGRRRLRIIKGPLTNHSSLLPFFLVPSPQILYYDFLSFHFMIFFRLYCAFVVLKPWTGQIKIIVTFLSSSRASTIICFFLFVFPLET